MKGLIDAAAVLADRQRGSPSQAALRRAASTLYFAVFDTLAGACADQVVGRTSSARASPLWLRVYRSVDHRDVLAGCKSVTGRGGPFERIGNAFVLLYDRRQEADYNPHSPPLSVDLVLALKAVAESALDDIRLLDAKSRGILTIEIMFRKRK